MTDPDRKATIYVGKDKEGVPLCRLEPWVVREAFFGTLEDPLLQAAVDECHTLHGDDGSVIRAYKIREAQAKLSAGDYDGAQGRRALRGAVRAARRHACPGCGQIGECPEDTCSVGKRTG